MAYCEICNEVICECDKMKDRNGNEVKLRATVAFGFRNYGSTVGGIGIVDMIVKKGVIAKNRCHPAEYDWAIIKCSRGEIYHEVESRAIELINPELTKPQKARGNCF